MHMIKQQKLQMPIDCRMFKFKHIFYLLCLFNMVSVSASDKLALVIGNGNYEHSPLNNALNDAKDMADAFKKLGLMSSLKLT